MCAMAQKNTKPGTNDGLSKPLKEKWMCSELKNLADYFHLRLHGSSEMAKANPTAAQSNMKDWFDIKSCLLLCQSHLLLRISPPSHLLKN